MNRYKGKDILCSPAAWNWALAEELSWGEPIRAYFRSMEDPDRKGAVAVDMRGCCQSDILFHPDKVHLEANSGTITYNHALFALPHFSLDPIKRAFPDKLVLFKEEKADRDARTSEVRPNGGPGNAIDITISDSFVLVRPKKDFGGQGKIVSTTLAFSDYQRAWKGHKGRIARLLEPQLVDKTDRSKIKQILHAAVELTQFYACEDYLSSRNAMPVMFPWKANWGGAVWTILGQNLAVRDMLESFWQSTSGDLKFTLRGDWVDGRPAALIFKEGQRQEPQNGEGGCYTL